MVNVLTVASCPATEMKYQLSIYSNLGFIPLAMHNAMQCNVQSIK